MGNEMRHRRKGPDPRDLHRQELQTGDSLRDGREEGDRMDLGRNCQFYEWAKVMRRALTVGVDDYAKAPLSGCVKDAAAIEGLLSKHEDGSPNFDCMLVTAPSGQVTRKSLKKQVEELFQHEADVALFYFSGHGTANNLGGYLVTQA